MLPSQHVFSHQHQYPQAEPSWLHQQPTFHQPQHTNPVAHHHAQAQAQAAAVAQAQHFNRLAVNNNNAHSVNADHNMGPNAIDSNWIEENRRVLGWVAELMSGSSRETALMELSKKREQVPELALIIWHSFGLKPSRRTGINGVCIDGNSGVMTSLLQEIISVYPLLNPSQLTAAASNRVCNALALLQCVASHNETRGLFLAGILSVSQFQTIADSPISTHTFISLSFPQYNFQIPSIRIPATDVTRCYWGSRQERFVRRDQLFVND